MASSSSSAKVLRRSGRVFAEEQDNIGLPKVVDSRACSSCDENENDRLSRASRSSSLEFTDRTEAGMVRRVNLGKDMNGIFPNTHDEMQEQVANSSEASRETKDLLSEATISLESSEGPLKKIEGKPITFGRVCHGIYRSGFPQLDDHEFLKSLKLKTIVTLVNKEYPDGFIDFIRANGIKHHIIGMVGTKKEAIPRDTMRSIMKIVLDSASHPILIHCNKGKHRTGCAVAVIRHASGWKLQDIIDEYKEYADDKIRDCDIKYIRKYHVSDLKGLFLSQDKRAIWSSRGFRYFVAALLLIWVFCSLHQAQHTES